MAKILAIDTSGPTGFAAASIEGEEADIKFDAGRSGGGILLKSVSRLLAGFGLGIDKLTHIAVGVGPGKYIRLRTGIALANGIASALAIPIVQVDSLAVLAYSCIADPKKIAAARESGRGKLFAGLGLVDTEDPLFDPRKPWKFGPIETATVKLAESPLAAASLLALDGDASSDFQYELRLPCAHFAHVHNDAKAQTLIRLTIEGIRRNRFSAFAVPIYGEPART